MRWLLMSSVSLGCSSSSSLLLASDLMTWKVIYHGSIFTLNYAILIKCGLKGKVVSSITLILKVIIIASVLIFPFNVITYYILEL